MGGEDTYYVQWSKMRLLAYPYFIELGTRLRRRINHRVRNKACLKSSSLPIPMLTQGIETHGHQQPSGQGEAGHVWRVDAATKKHGILGETFWQCRSFKTPRHPRLSASPFTLGRLRDTILVFD